MNPSVLDKYSKQIDALEQELEGIKKGTEARIKEGSKQEVRRAVLNVTIVFLAVFGIEAIIILYLISLLA